MELRMPEKGELYKHFKGKLYEIMAVAMHTETEEMMVVYQEVNGENVYVRPLEMFVSKVNREKYPDVPQEFRFERVQKEEATEHVEEQKDSSLIMDFLDMCTVNEKILYLENVKDRITSGFLEVAAQSLDFVEKEGSLSKRYQELLRYLRTVAKYERMR